MEGRIGKGPERKDSGSGGGRGELSLHILASGRGRMSRPVRRLGFTCLKGTVQRDFRLKFSYMDQFPLAPDYTIRAVSYFFRKFAEIFARQGAPPVSTTPVANLPPVSTTRNDPCVIFRGLWENDYEKNLKEKIP